MTLADLDEAERLAMAALIRFLVRVDGQFTPAEVQALARLARDVGSTEFWSAMREAQQRMETADDMVDAVEKVERRDVQEWIYGILMGIAAVGGIAPAETQVLDWLAETWQLHD